MTSAWIALLVVGCVPDDLAAAADPPPVDLATPADGWLRGDLHFHTNYSDDALEQGGDWMGPALDIADAWRDPTWTAAFPGRAPEDHLQFVAVTDHRTTDGWADPDFAHDYLVVVGGEEYGSDGHAGVWGHQAHIPHESQAGESPTQRIQDSIGEAHAQGGLFSINHPASDGDLWGWNVTGFDGVEVWNGPWGAVAAPLDVAMVSEWEAAYGPANAWLHSAAATQGVTQNSQALRFWQAALSSGEHAAPVGGGDRHMVFPAGLPTTYVAVESRTPEGVIDGIASKRTFVSRGPQGPQVILTAEADGRTWPMGSELPLGGTVTVSWEVGRAAGGELRLVAGALGEGEAAAVVHTVPIETNEDVGTWDWTPPGTGGWLHAIVVDPLPADVPADLATVEETLLTFRTESGVAGLVGALAPLLDIEVFADPSLCDPADWDEWTACCMPADTEPYATFYLPDPLQRLLGAEFEDSAPTGYAMGAISAAFMVR